MNGAVFHVRAESQGKIRHLRETIQVCMCIRESHTPPVTVPAITGAQCVWVCVCVCVCVCDNQSTSSVSSV